MGVCLDKWPPPLLVLQLVQPLAIPWVLVSPECLAEDQRLRQLSNNNNNNKILLHINNKTLTPQEQVRHCDADARNFTRCLEENDGNMQTCGYYLQQLKACQEAARQY